MSVVQFAISNSCFNVQEGLGTREDETLLQLNLIRERLAVCKQPSGSFVAQMLRDVEAALGHSTPSDQPHPPNLATLSVSLAAALPQYDAILRKAVGGGSTCTCFRNLRHEFLVVRESNCQMGVEVIVDPTFRSQFDIPHPTEEYLGLQGLVPLVFVGTACQLAPIVHLLCAGMACSFVATGQMIPPWRKADSVVSKWFSEKVRDTAVTATRQQLQQQQQVDIRAMFVADKFSRSEIRRSNSGQLTASALKRPAQSERRGMDTFSLSLHHPFCLALPQQQPQQQQRGAVFDVSSSCVRSCPEPMIQVSGFNVQQAC